MSLIISDVSQVVLAVTIPVTAAVSVSDALFPSAVVIDALGPVLSIQDSGGASVAILDVAG